MISSKFVYPNTTWESLLNIFLTWFLLRNFDQKNFWKTFPPMTQLYQNPQHLSQFFGRCQESKGLSEKIFDVASKDRSFSPMVGRLRSAIVSKHVSDTSRKMCIQIFWDSSSKLHICLLGGISQQICLPIFSGKYLHKNRNYSRRYLQMTQSFSQIPPRLASKCTTLFQISLPKEDKQILFRFFSRTY